MRLNEQPWAVHTSVPEGSPAQELGCPGSPWASHRLLFRSSQSLHISAAGGAKSLQLCLTLRDPMDCSLPGSSDHGIHSPGKNIGMDCHFLLQGIFPRRDGTHVSYDSCIGWPVLCHERHLDRRSLQCKTRAGFLGLIHADKSPEDLRNVFLSEGLQSGPPSPFLLPFHTLRNCLQTAAPLFFFFFFANRVPADPTATSSSIGFLMQAQLHCGRSWALTLLEPSAHVPARTLSFLQAWLLTSQVGSNCRNK